VRGGEYTAETRISCRVGSSYAQFKTPFTIEELPARVGATFTVSIPIGARNARAVRGRQCAVDYVSLEPVEGSYEYPLTQSSIITGEQITVTPDR
jgi:hypothetical protein